MLRLYPLLSPTPDQAINEAKEYFAEINASRKIDALVSQEILAFKTKLFDDLTFVSFQSCIESILHFLNYRSGSKQQESFNLKHQMLIEKLHSAKLDFNNTPDTLRELDNLIANVNLIEEQSKEKQKKYEADAEQIGKFQQIKGVNYHFMQNLSEKSEEKHSEIHKEVLETDAKMEFMRMLIRVSTLFSPYNPEGTLKNFLERTEQARVHMEEHLITISLTKNPFIRNFREQTHLFWG